MKKYDGAPCSNDVSKPFTDENWYSLDNGTYLAYQLCGKNLMNRDGFGPKFFGPWPLWAKPNTII